MEIVQGAGLIYKNVISEILQSKARLLACIHEEQSAYTAHRVRARQRARRFGCRPIDIVDRTWSAGEVGEIREGRGWCVSAMLGGRIQKQRPEDKRSHTHTHTLVKHFGLTKQKYSADEPKEGTVGEAAVRIRDSPSQTQTECSFC